jgi:type II secretory pathway pseudopilin PulG
MNRRDGGYTYVAVMVLLAVLSLASALTLEVAQTSARRSGEAELIAIGKEFERAFASYHRQSPMGARRYPEKLEDLVRDPRLPGVKRHLRKVYVDPMTGAPWGTVAAPGGGIMAVYSTAPGQPYREDLALAMTPAPVLAASAPDAAGTQPTSYAEWRFGFDPQGQASGVRRPLDSR